MARIEEQIEIAAARSDVFRFCHDVSRWPQWDVRRMRVEGLSPGSVRRGSLLRIDAARGSEFAYTWDAEISEYHHLSSMTLKVIDSAPSSPFKSGTEQWTFSSMGGSTRLAVVWTYTPRNFIQKALDALGGRSGARRAIRRSLANLKRLIEAG